MIKKWLILSFLLLTGLALFLANYFLRFQDCSKCRSYIEQHYVSSEGSTIETYKKDCKAESKAGKTFPEVKPAYAVLHFDRLLQFPERLSKPAMDTLLQVLNDSGSYIWGEVGTPYFDRYITFHDAHDHPIGITQIDFCGQTYSTPHRAYMKWGALNDKAWKRLTNQIR